MSSFGHFHRRIINNRYFAVPSSHSADPETKPDDIWIGMNFASSSLVQTSVENAGPSEVDGLSMILQWSLMEIYYSSKIEDVSVKR